MTFQFTIHDRNGTQLKEHDIVKISDGRSFTFFAEVKWLADEQLLTPFSTFSFHSFEKVDKVPENAHESTETRYKIWYLYSDEAEVDNEAEYFKDYLMSWRECESPIEKRCFRITKVVKDSQQIKLEL